MSGRSHAARAEVGADVEVGSDGFAELDAAIDAEIRERQSSGLAWKKLEPCFKWSKILAYLEGCGIQRADPAVAEVRAQLRASGLPHLEYDTERNCVVRIGVGGL